MAAAITLIFGGSGKCARHITRLLSSQPNHTVYSIIRNADQNASIEALGGKPIVQSIEESSAEDMAATLRSTKATTVVWAAGAGGGNPERTRAVDHEGAVKSMDAAALAGVKRYIIISALDVRDREGKPEPEWYDDADRDRSRRVWDVINPYMRAKFAADRNLVTENARRGLEYTIVRPGGLSQDPAKGTVSAGKTHLNAMISREDVAAVVVECIKNTGTVGLAFDVVGGETKIEEAVAEVAKGRVDTFEGRY
ncbi:NAD(P)-binding protein [Polychaeton citri CBS 116435]|uniref:NAD(P)-binding protein n=1 Tax=Polychaeton citri CBS 116435 TaxID=1314669 RepID=A0A9P4Q7Z1_9PEZI|nr:NAD(P)-binding protein [Polychaeton citri CBS 116435]